MNLADELASGLKELEGELTNSGVDATFSWRGVSYPCVMSTSRRGAQIEVGGALKTIELTLYVRKTEMPEITVDMDTITVDSTAHTVDAVEPISSGQKVTRRGQTYRVIEVRESSFGSHLELDLGSPHQ